jgi:phosphate-selective porin
VLLSLRDEITLTSTQVEMGMQLVAKLRGVSEKWHEFEYHYMRDKYDSTGIALRLAGVEIVNENVAHLKWGYYRPHFDLEYQDGETYQSKMEELYGWYNIIGWHDEWRGLSYLDNRLRLTFLQISDVIEAFLQGAVEISLDR